jgi:hypothetical protein
LPSLVHLPTYCLVSGSSEALVAARSCSAISTLRVRIGIERPAVRHAERSESFSLATDALLKIRVALMVTNMSQCKLLQSAKHGLTINLRVRCYYISSNGCRYYSGCLETDREYAEGIYFFRLLRQTPIQHLGGPHIPLLSRYSCTLSIRSAFFPAVACPL